MSKMSLLILCFRKLEKLERKDKSSKSKKKTKKKRKSKRKLEDSDSDESSSDSEESERGRKSHKEKKKPKKDKDKRRDRHCKNVSVKKEPRSSSDSELSSKALEKALGRCIEFAGPPDAATGCSEKRQPREGSSDRDHKKTRDKSHKEEIRKRDEKCVNGIKHSRDDGKLSDERNRRKRSREGNDDSSRKKQRQ
jgi:hypothetical protein